MLSSTTTTTSPTQHYYLRRPWPGPPHPTSWALPNSQRCFAWDRHSLVNRCRVSWVVGWSVDSLIGFFACMWCYHYIWRWTNMELSFFWLLSDCPKKLLTLTRNPSTALRRGLHFLAPRDFGCFPPDDFKPMEMFTQITGKGKQIKVFQKVRVSKFATANSKQYLSMFQQNHHNSGVKLWLPHTSYGWGPRNHISHTFALARSVVSTPPHWEAPSNAVAGPFQCCFGMSTVWANSQQIFTKMYLHTVTQCFSELQCLKYSKKVRKNHLWCFSRKKTCPTWTHQSLVISILVASLNVDIRRAIHKLRQVEHMLLGNVGQAQIPMLIDLPFVGFFLRYNFMSESFRTALL